MHTHSHQGGSGGSHSHSNHHGHSHRSGAATRYWRDPKAIAVTIVVFLILFFSFGFGRTDNVENSHTTQQTDISLAILLPQQTKLVVWHDGTQSSRLDSIDGVFVRSFENNILTSCEFINRMKKAISPEERAAVKFTYCSTMDCVWMLAQLALRPDVIHVVTADLRKRIEKSDATLTKTLGHIKLDNGDLADLVASELKHSANAAVFSRMSTIDDVCHRFPFTEAKPIMLGKCTKPGDRTCDSQCPGVENWFYRADLRSCVSGSACSMLTSAACLDDRLKALCKSDCEQLFFKEMRIESTRDTTVAICLITLFLLGFVLGLLFAKLYWVDPLLDENERLKGPEHHESH